MALSSGFLAAAIPESKRKKVFYASSGPPFRTEGGVGGAIRENPMARKIEAVRKDAIYACPVGTFWWDRPSPEAILGFLWLARILYPDHMAWIDMKQETVFFFRHFYHYDLTDADFNAVMNTSDPEK